VNRVVPRGAALETALELARTIAAFPQVCLRGDRQSAYDALERSFDEAMANELSLGMRALSREAVEGATRFVGGAGRHGEPT
jgi:enoyl-CoA hydratase